MTTKFIFQEDDALINGRDPDYRGIHDWWPKHFLNRKFVDDWDAAVETQVDGGDSFTRTICVHLEEASEVFEVTYSFEGYCVRQLIPFTIEDLDGLGQLADSSEYEEVTLP